MNRNDFKTFESLFRIISQVLFYGIHLKGEETSGEEIHQEIH